jgi:hypothetical protein
MFPFTAALRAFVADGAPFGRLIATRLKFKNLNASLRFSPTIITELGLKLLLIFATLLFLADDIKVTLGNQRLKMRNLFSTGRGFLIFPTECETMITGFLLRLRALFTIRSIIIL